MTRRTELLGLRVQREQRGIALHTVVEPVDERLEERHAADRVVERDLTLHASSLRTRPYPPSMIRVRRSPDAGSFLADAGPFLGEREAEHNLLFGICASLLHDPSAFGRGAPYLAIAEHDGRVVAAAVRTPPHNVVLSVTDDVAAIGSLAQDAHDATGSLPGVVGPSDVATAFARAWCDLVGCAATRRMANRIYRASHVTLPSGVPGAMRAYRDDNHALAIHWLDAFVREALPDEAADESSDDMLQRRLADPDGDVRFWEDRRQVRLVGELRPADPERHPGRPGVHATGASRQGIRQRAGGPDDGRAPRRPAPLLLPIHRPGEPDGERHLSTDRVRSRERRGALRVRLNACGQWTAMMRSSTAE